MCTRTIIVITAILLLFTFVALPVGLAQQKDELSLSIGASAGYAPTLTFGERDDSGAVVGLSGDLQYQNIIGQLDFIYVISETVSSEFFRNGLGFFWVTGI